MRSMLDHIRKSPHRVKLERLLKKTLPMLEGNILEVGSRNRRYDHLLKSRPIAIDIVANEAARVQFGDITEIPFAAESFDSLICLEVLEYVSAPDRAINEMYRVLRSGGTLVLSVPFMFKVHEDKLRYTAPHLRELLSKFELVDFQPVGGSYTVILTILWGKIKSVSFLPLRYLVTIFFLPLLIFSGNSTQLGEQYASGYFVVAKK